MPPLALDLSSMRKKGIPVFVGNLDMVTSFAVSHGCRAPCNHIIVASSSDAVHNSKSWLRVHFELIYENLFPSI